MSIASSMSRVCACGATTTRPSTPCSSRWPIAARTAPPSAESANAADTQYPAARAAASIASMLRDGP